MIADNDLSLPTTQGTSERCKKQQQHERYSLTTLRLHFSVHSAIRTDHGNIDFSLSIRRCYHHAYPGADTHRVSVGGDLPSEIQERLFSTEWTGSTTTVCRRHCWQSLCHTGGKWPLAGQESGIRRILLDTGIPSSQLSKCIHSRCIDHNEHRRPGSFLQSVQFSSRPPRWKGSRCQSNVLTDEKDSHERAR